MEITSHDSWNESKVNWLHERMTRSTQLLLFFSPFFVRMRMAQSKVTSTLSISTNDLFYVQGWIKEKQEGEKE